jgi:hypothetical protein
MLTAWPAWTPKWQKLSWLSPVEAFSAFDENAYASEAGLTISPIMVFSSNAED